MAEEQTPLILALMAGEPSGDRQAAHLLTVLRARVAPRPVSAWGIGGAHMAAAGVRLLVNSDGSGAIGIAEALSAIPKGLVALGRVKGELKKTPPDALVCVDAGAFNVPLGRWTRANKICPVFYYFPPGSWRKTPKSQGLSGSADRVVTPFSWSAKLLQAAGEDAHFVGHPLLDQVNPTLTDHEFYTRFGLDAHRPLVALLPGSRRFEVVHNLPVMAAAAGRVAARIPGTQFVVALAAPALRSLTERILRHAAAKRPAPEQTRPARDPFGGALGKGMTPPVLATNEGVPVPLPLSDEADERGLPWYAPRFAARPAPLVIAEGLTYDVLARADFVITKSGTSTLEAAILRKPMAIIYRGSALMGWEWKMRKKNLAIPHIGLPNILAGERIVTELLGDEATPDVLASLTVDMLLEPDRLLQTKQRLMDIMEASLGEPGGTARAADLLLDLIATHEHRN